MGAHDNRFVQENGRPGLRGEALEAQEHGYDLWDRPPNRQPERKAGDWLLVRVSVIYRPTEDGWVGEILTAHLIRDIVAEEVLLWP